MVSRVASVSRVENSSRMCSSQRSLSFCWAGVSSGLFPEAWLMRGPLLRHDYRFFSGQGVAGGFVEVEVGRDEFRRRMSEPFRQGKVLITVRLEHFQEFQVRGSSVFDIVRKRFLDVPDVAGLEIHGASAATGCENGHAALAAEKILP